MYKVVAGIYTNNYVETKCVIIRAMFIIAVIVRTEYTIGFDVTLLKVPAMFVSPHGLMTVGL